MWITCKDMPGKDGTHRSLGNKHRGPYRIISPPPHIVCICVCTVRLCNILRAPTQVTQPDAFGLSFSSSCTLRLQPFVFRPCCHTIDTFPLMAKFPPLVAPQVLWLKICGWPKLRRRMSRVLTASKSLSLHAAHFAHDHRKSGLGLGQISVRKVLHCI